MTTPPATTDPELTAHVKVTAVVPVGAPASVYSPTTGDPLVPPEPTVIHPGGGVMVACVPLGACTATTAASWSPAPVGPTLTVRVVDLPGPVATASPYCTGAMPGAGTCVASDHVSASGEPLMEGQPPKVTALPSLAL